MDDALKLLGYMDDCGIDLADVSLDDLHGFAAAMGDLGIAPRSQARIISGVKSLFRFLSALLIACLLLGPTALTEELPEVEDGTAT